MDLILNYLQQGLSAVVPFVILLGLLIFVHELGHFWVAKLCGVRVEVFSLGFGKKILSFKRGETTYAISLIPLGGYVKMYGDEMGADIPEDQKNRSFLHKPVSQRIAIVLAGPLMNFFFAILVFFVVAMIGEDARSPVLGDIPEGTRAYEIGLRPGDEVVSVAGQNVKSWEEIQHELNLRIGQNVDVVLKRYGTTEPLKFVVSPKSQPNPNILSLDDYIGEVEGLSHNSIAALVGIQSGTVAHKMGLRTGDRIARVNGQEVKYFRELEPLLLPHQGQKVALEVERFPSLTAEKGEMLEFDLVLPQFASVNGLGIERSDLYLAKIIESSPAEKAGLQAGDRVLTVDGKKIRTWEDILSTVKSYSGEGDLRFVVSRNGSEKSLDIKPEITSQMTMQGSEEKRYTVGILPWIAMGVPQMTKLKSDSLGKAFIRGIDRTWDVTVMTVVSFLRLAQNKISPKNIGGVISIGQAASETFKIGMSQFLTMMGLISVNLFILNLLPIPVLDGGHLLFYTIEALRGGPLSMRKMEIAQQVGLVLLMSLMVFALFNDFSRLFGFH